MNTGSVAVIALVLVASAADAEDRVPLDKAQLPASPRPYLELAALDANAENSVRMLVPADEASGVAQIEALVGRSSFEEQWAFVPAIDLWIEIGINESASELDSQVEVDIDYLKEIVGLYRDVRIVHFHPASFYAQVWQREPYRVEFPADAVGNGSVQPIGFALPSPTDVVSSIELSNMLFAEDPQNSISYSVVSPHGLVTYGLTTRGLRTVAYDWGNPRATVARSIVTRIAIRRMTFNIASTIAALDSPTIGEVIEALCAQASDENYELSFRQF
jgi:hypothetical protein